MKTFSILILLILTLGGSSCKSQKKQIKSPVPVGDNSMISLDWDGTYQGILPCADCPGIKTQLVLNKDLTYQIKTSYLERGVGLDTEGEFSWNKAGNIITLDDNYPQKYLVGENQLFSLDGDGNKITGDLATRFILIKAIIELYNKNWKLISLNNKPVISDVKQAFIVFDENENAVSGNTGCNNFFGTFELSGENGIKFSELGMTKMACIGENPEKEFVEIMGKTTNYSLTLNCLILKDSSGNNLATFAYDFFVD